MNTPLLIGLLVGSYLLGSLPFGLWIARRWAGVDIRTVGSGNIGSTNVGRICGPKAGALVFVLDVLKGLLPPLIVMGLHFGRGWPVLAGLLAIVGHNYSIFLRFQGGKGISTSLGALVGAAPPVGFAGLLLWGVVVVLTRWVSLGSLLAALSLPPLMLLFYPGDPYRLAFGVAAMLLAVYKHRANIARLRAKTEPQITLPWQKRADTGKPR